MLLNALDYAGLQEALDAAQDGDRIYVPSGVWRTPNTGAFRVSKSVEIFGDGAGAAAGQTGTVFVPSAAGMDVFSVEPGLAELRRVYFHNFKIDYNVDDPLNPIRPRRGISCDTPASVGTVRCEGLFILNTISDAIHVVGSNAGVIEQVAVFACTCGGAGGGGLGGFGAYISYVRRLTTLRSEFGACVAGGIYCDNGCASLYATGFELNGDASATAPAIAMRSLHLKTCDIAVVESCRFENFYYGSPAVACRIEQCRGAVQAVAGLFILGNIPPATTPSVRFGIEVTAGSGPVTVLENYFARVSPHLIAMDPSALGVYVSSQRDFVENGTTYTEGNVLLPGLGSNGGMLAAPFVRRSFIRPDGSDPDDRVGVLCPAMFTDGGPTGVTQDGMLYFEVDTGELKARIQGQWRVIVVI